MSKRGFPEAHQKEAVAARGGYIARDEAILAGVGVGERARVDEVGGHGEVGDERGLVEVERRALRRRP